MLNRRRRVLKSNLRSTPVKRPIRGLVISVAVLLGANTAVIIPLAGAQPAAVDAEYPEQAPVIAYATRDAAGVWSFSDIPDPTARTIPLPQSASTALSSDELIAQMLDVAAALETARLAREERRATQFRESENPAPSPTIAAGQRNDLQYDDSPYGYSPYAHPPQRRHHRSRQEPEPAPPTPERAKRRIRFPIDF